MEKSYYDNLIEDIEEVNKAYAQERQIKKEEKAKMIKNLKIRKKKIASFLAGSGITLALVTGVIAYNNSPVQVVVRELLADADLAKTDNDRKIDSKMTSEELVDYIDDHNLTLEEVRDTTIAKLKWDNLYTDENMRKIDNCNREAMDEMVENSKKL